MRFCEGQAVQLYIDLSVILNVLTLPTRLKSRRKISLKALDFRAFAGLEEKQLRGAESSVETYPRLSSNALEE